MHFTESDFTIDNKLKPSVVPTRFMTNDGLWLVF